MRCALLISTLICTVTVIAAPGATSLNRFFKTISVRGDNNAEGTAQIACIECPCTGWSDDCTCIKNGCCCDMTNPAQPPAGGW